jgi:hypothetical protein
MSPLSPLFTALYSIIPASERSSGAGSLAHNEFQGSANPRRNYAAPKLNALGYLGVQG